MQKLHAKDLTKEIIDSANLFSVTGDDKYYTDKAERAFSSLVADDFRDFNLTVIDNLSSAEQLSDATSRYPSFSDVTVVIVRDSDKKKDFGKSELSAVLQRVPEWCKLVGINFGALSATDSLSMINISADKLKSHELKAEIRSLFPDNGITAEGVDRLSYYADCDMGRIVMEAEKLKCFAPDRAINEADVELLVTPDDEHKIYEFTEAVLNKKTALAERLLDRMLKQGLKKESLLGSLISQYRRLFYVSCSKESDVKLASILGVKEYAVIKLRETAKKYSAVVIRDSLNALTRLEYEIRRGDLSADTGFGLAKNILYA